MSLFQSRVLDLDFEPSAPMPRAEVERPVRVTKATVRQDIVAEIQSNGMQTPLEFLVRILNDENLPRNERVDAAKATLPYVHSRLNSVDINANVAVSHEDALAFLEQED
jgi:uncharacterized protein (UPF0147 family)